MKFLLHSQRCNIQTHWIIRTVRLPYAFPKYWKRRLKTVSDRIFDANPKSKIKARFPTTTPAVSISHFKEQVDHLTPNMNGVPKRNSDARRRSLDHLRDNFLSHLINPIVSVTSILVQKIAIVSLYVISKQIVREPQKPVSYTDRCQWLRTWLLIKHFHRSTSMGFLIATDA